ncbi:hypothetical protein ACWIG4_06955 [Streptomyces sp. NPDC002248]
MSGGLARTIAWCAWHRGLAEDVALIDVVEPASGPGTAGRLFACHRCRESYRLTPYAQKERRSATYDFRPGRGGELPHHEEEKPMGDDNNGHGGTPAPIEPWQPPTEPPNPDSDSSGTGTGSHGGGSGNDGNGGS